MSWVVHTGLGAPLKREKGTLYTFTDVLKEAFELQAEETYSDIERRYLYQEQRVADTWIQGQLATDSQPGPAGIQREYGRICQTKKSLGAV